MPILDQETKNQRISEMLSPFIEEKPEFTTLKMSLEKLESAEGAITALKNTQGSLSFDIYNMVMAGVLESFKTAINEYHKIYTEELKEMLLQAKQYYILQIFEEIGKYIEKIAKLYGQSIDEIMQKTHQDSK